MTFVSHFKARIILGGLAAAALWLGGCIPGSDDSGPGNCGDGIVDPDEQCDDGNLVDHDGCSATCVLETYCGNSVVEYGEECDDGNSQPGDGCNASCETEVGCGNGSLEVGEQCDDDNLVDGDGCSALCLDEQMGAVCGNGIMELGEGCEDGNTVAGDGCSPDCVREDGCGNGVEEGIEQCDDGNNISGDGCSADCHVEYICGNNVCEESSYETCEACPSDCCPACGNGVLDAGEECDDGNNDDGDGCSGGCADEQPGAVCGNGIWEQGEECEDGNTDNQDGCSDTCEVEFECGDQVCESAMGETCALCQPDCCPNCGNGVREVNRGEQCDWNDLGGLDCEDFCYDGGTLTCTSGCTFDVSQCTGTGPVCGDGYAECEEQCDLSDLKGRDCQALGYTQGSLSCKNVSCTYDLSGCSGLIWYFFDDFEDQGSTSSKWTFSGNWEWGAPSGVGSEPPAAFAGNYCIGTGMGAQYPDGADYTTFQAVTVPILLTVATSPMLIFRGWIDTESCCDGVTVLVSNDNGQTWSVLPNPSVPYNGNISGRDCWVGQLGAWQEFSFDLAAFVGQTIQLAFAFASDGSVTYYGPYVDNVLVTEAGFVPIVFTTPPNLRRASVGGAYSKQLEVTGGTGAYNWSVVGGTNHGWLSLDPVSGVLSGTPAQANVGPVTVDVRCEESTNATNNATQSFNLEVVEPLPLPYLEDFEGSYPTDWIVDGNWEWGTPSVVGPAGCLDGVSCAGTNIDGIYSPNQAYNTCVLETPPIDLTGASQPTLSFFHWMRAGDTWDFDGGNVKVSTNGGNTWSLLTPAGGYDGLNLGEQSWFGDRSALGWQRELVDLTAYVGQTVNLRFAFASTAWNEYDGWYVDAVSVTEASQVPVAITTGASLGMALTNLPFNRPLVAMGGTGSFDWSIEPGGTNDGWLSIDPATGVLSGTPDATDLGSASVVVRAAVVGNPANYAEKIFSLDVVTGIWMADFEGGAAGWTFSGDWEWGTPTGFTGTWGGIEPATCFGGTGCIGTGMGQEYSDGAQYASNRAVSPSINLTTATNPLLSFRTWVTLESCCDGSNVWISTNGVTWTVLQNPSVAYNTVMGMESAWTGQALEVWTEVTFDLAAYAGQTIQLAFALYTDGSITYPGMYVDDILVLD
ncbi:MAG: DUF4215 domain-containing protein [bacterium]